jgi:hypothetical protein
MGSRMTVEQLKDLTVPAFFQWLEDNYIELREAKKDDENRTYRVEVKDFRKGVTVAAVGKDPLEAMWMALESILEMRS